jgi:hypothetical protein
VRAAALSRFGERALKPGRPLAALADLLVPLFLLHRYQTEAAVKLLGGLDFRYALRGDGQKPATLVPAEDQRQALRAVLATLAPAALTLPESLLSLLPPRPPEYNRTRDSFPGHTGLTFDPLGAAEAAATHTLSLLLAPDRAARLAEHHARDSTLPGLHDVLSALLDATWHAAAPQGLAGAVKLRVDYVALRHLLALAANGSPIVRALARQAVRELRGATPPDADVVTAAHWADAMETIDAFFRAPDTFRKAGTLPVPPGSPI